MDPYHPWDWYIYLHFLVDSYGFHLGIHIQQVPWSMRHGGDGWHHTDFRYVSLGFNRISELSNRVRSTQRGVKTGLCEVKTTAKGFNIYIYIYLYLAEK